MKFIFACVIFLWNSFLFCSGPAFLHENSGWAEKTLQSLTLREKIGQLFIVPAASCFEQPTEILATSLFASPYAMDEVTVTRLITQYHVGGVIFLYKSAPALQLPLTQHYQQLSKIPLLMMQDCEWGLAMRLDKDPTQVVTYPKNNALGMINDAELVYQLGKEIGKQCKALGIHLNCAPVVDIYNNPDNHMMRERSFGPDKDIVARLGAAYAQGIEDAGIFACAKHFPGHGDTTVDSHHALPVINHEYEHLDAVELYPFRKLIASGMSGIMTGHLALPKLTHDTMLPATLSYDVITTILKKKLGFEGLIITDALGMKAITDTYTPGECALQALRAGNDILLCSVDVPQAIESIEHAIHNGMYAESELDYHVLKILKAKEWVLNQGQEQEALNNPLTYIIRDEARHLAQEIHERSVIRAQ